MEAEHPGARVFGTETLPHDLSPEATRSSELGHLLEEIVLADEEEGEPASEGIDIEPSIYRRLNIGDAVCQG